MSHELPYKEQARAVAAASGHIGFSEGGRATADEA